MKGLLKCCQVLNRIYTTYDIHPDITNRTGARNFPDAIKMMSAVTEEVNQAVVEALELQQLTIKCPKGPHGVISSETTKSLNMAKKTAN